MPRNQFQRMVFAFITVVITVHANLAGSLLSFKPACRVFNPAKNHPMIFETAIICVAVGIFMLTFFAVLVNAYEWGVIETFTNPLCHITGL